MNTHHGRIGKIAASLGLAMSLLLLATCESSLLTEIRAAGDAARGSEVTYQITFDANGGSGTMSKQSVKYEQTVTLNPINFTRTGYGFDGWAMEPDGEVVYSNSAEYTHNVTRDMTLYAQWAAGEYKVYFDANDGLGSMDPQDVAFEQTVTLNANNGDITRTGYTFVGWATTKVGTVVYPDGSAYIHEIENDRTLYAKWTANKYTVTFNPNHGTTPPSERETKEVTYDSTYGTLATTTRTGYTFEGWWTTSSSGGIQITEATVVTITSVQTLYARWTINSYAITYNGNEATSGEVPTASSHEYSALVTVASPTDLRGTLIGQGISQRFVEWNTEQHGTGASYQPFDSFDMPGHDVTLFAIFTTGSDRIGKVGPAGGILFYDHGLSHLEWRYLEAWTADEADVYQWKIYLSETPGTSTDVGSGYENTYSAMTGPEHPAAEVVRNATHGEFHDWFLPSRDELDLMYQLKEVVGGFREVDDQHSYYRSSSESSESPWTAWLQHFNNGFQHQGNLNKFYFGRVRAVRAF